MKPYSQEAAEIHLAFRAGLVEKPAIIQWADSVIASMDQYDDDLADIALSARKLPMEIDSMLLHASEGADRIQATRHLLGQMHEAMLRDRGLARDFARVLAHIVFENRYKLPKDLHFLFGLNDWFDLAEHGEGGTVRGVTNAFIKSTEPYFQRTGDDQQSSQSSAPPSGFWSRIGRLADLLRGKKRKEPT